MTIKKTTPIFSNLKKSEIIFLSILLLLQLLTSTFAVLLFNVDQFGGPLPFYADLLFFAPLLGDVLYLYSARIQGKNLRVTLKTIALLISTLVIFYPFWIVIINFLMQ